MRIASLSLPVALLLTLAGCAPAPLASYRSGQPALAVNWPQELRAAAERQDLPQLDGKAPEQVLQEELVRQLGVKGRFAGIEARAAGQSLRPFPGARAELLLETTLERLELRRDGRGSTSLGMGLGTGHFGVGIWQPFPGRDYDDLCAVAEVRTVLQNARTGEVVLENLYRDSSCRSDAATRLGRDRLYDSLGREALIKAVGRLTEAVDQLFY